MIAADARSPTRK
jgi:hypothetical protein